jgi:hypothetical protein
MLRKRAARVSDVQQMTLPQRLSRLAKPAQDTVAIPGLPLHQAARERFTFF